MPEEKYQVPTSVSELIRQFLMGDLSPENQRIVTAFWFRLLVRSVFLFFMLWALGWMTWAGLSAGFARADEVKIELEERTAKLEAEVHAIKQAHRLTSRQVASILRLNLEREMHRLAEQYCKSEPNSNNRENITRLIRASQAQYRDVNKGKNYNIPDCEDL